MRSLQHDRVDPPSGFAGEGAVEAHVQVRAVSFGVVNDRMRAPLEDLVEPAPVLANRGGVIFHEPLDQRSMKMYSTSLSVMSALTKAQVRGRSRLVARASVYQGESSR